MEMYWDINRELNNMSKMAQKILFIRSSKSSFIEKDIEFLRRHFEVRVIDVVLSRKNLSGTLVTMFNMITGVYWSDITFSWFADIYACCAVRLSKLFRKKSIVIIGGYEVVKLPEIDYGALLYPKYARRTKYVLENANKVLTVDEGLKIDAIKNVGVIGVNIQTVPTCYDYDIFKPEGKKENFVLTVAAINTWNKVRLKGLDTFVKSAWFLPEIKFLIIGIEEDALKKLQDIASSNVLFFSEIYQEALIPYYQKSKVYCQLSMREGLPNALCEAMLCECVPVGTEVQGVKTAIGNTGYYVPYGDAYATAEAIKEAINSNKGKEARERIKTIFPIEKRERELKRIIEEL